MNRKMDLTDSQKKLLCDLAHTLEKNYETFRLYHTLARGHMTDHVASACFHLRAAQPFYALSDLGILLHEAARASTPDNQEEILYATQIKTITIEILKK